MSDLFNRVTDDQNVFQKLLAKIPGFKGYFEKTNRRAADKILRETLANRFEEQWKRISSVQRDLISAGGLEHITQLESSSLKLRQFIDRVRRASYGYAGFFDAVKINEDELSKVYQYDLALFNMAEEVGRAVDNVEASIDTDGLPAAMRHLKALSQQCLDAYNKRQEAMIGDVTGSEDIAQ
jgi:DNA polymerase I-like protein with 3'-5' exonuclease and polymerase domains